MGFGKLRLAFLILNLVVFGRVDALAKDKGPGLGQTSKNIPSSSSRASSVSSNCVLNQFVHHREFGFGVIQSASPLIGAAFEVASGSLDPADRCFVYYFHPPRHAAAGRLELTSVEEPKCHSYSNCTSGSGRSKKHIQVRLCNGELYQGERVFGIRKIAGSPDTFQIITSRAGIDQAHRNMSGGSARQELTKTAPVPEDQIPLEVSERQRRLDIMKADDERRDLLRQVFNVQTVNLRDVWEQESHRIVAGGGIPHNFTVEEYTQSGEYNRENGQNTSCPQTDQERDIKELDALERGPLRPRPAKGAK